jgi:hypothetical protein
MKTVLRLLLSLVLAAILVFCFFGFLATFEPLDRSVQVTWRVVYGIIGIACVGGFILIWLRWNTKHSRVINSTDRTDRTDPTD